MSNTTAENKKANMVFVEPKSTKIPFCIASILFIMTPIIELIIGLVKLFIEASHYSKYTEGLKMAFNNFFIPQFINAEFILGSLIMIALGILLIFKRSGIETAIALILYASIGVFSYFSFLESVFYAIRFGYFDFNYFMTALQATINCIAVFLSLILLALLVLMLLKKKPRSTVSLLCFVPGIVLFVWNVSYDIINIIMNVINKVSVTHILSNSIKLTDYLFPIAIILLGLWLYQVWGTYGTMKKAKKQ